MRSVFFCWLRNERSRKCFSHTLLGDRGSGIQVECQDVKTLLLPALWSDLFTHPSCNEMWILCIKVVITQSYVYCSSSYKGNLKNFFSHVVCNNCFSWLEVRPCLRGAANILKKKHLQLERIGPVDQTYACRQADYKLAYFEVLNVYVGYCMWLLLSILSYIKTFNGLNLLYYNYL